MHKCEAQVNEAMCNLGHGSKCVTTLLTVTYQQMPLWYNAHVLHEISRDKAGCTLPCTTLPSCSTIVS